MMVFTVNLQKSLANFVFNFDKNIVEQSYQDGTLSLNVKYLYAQKVIISQDNKQTLILSQSPKLSLE